MSDFFHVICHCSFFILTFGLINRLLKNKLNLSEPMVSLTYGIIVGPYFLNILDPNYFKAKDVLYYTSKVVLCIQTMTAGMLLPHGYILNQWKSILMLVVGVGFTKYIITFLIIYYFSKYNMMTSFAMSACLTPTDPILSVSIIKSRFVDEYIPERLRCLLAAESGINDGFGLLLLFLPIDLTLNKNLSDGISDLLFSTILYKTILPAFIGLLIGILARRALLLSYSNNMTGVDTFVIYGITLASFVLGFSEVLQMSELVCEFFTGTAFSWNEWFVLETRASRLQEIADSLFITSFFVLFGTRINFDKISGRLILITIIIICFRRIIACLILYRYIPLVANKKEAIFLGWFGPIGVGALYYSLFFDRIMGTITFDAVGFIVMTSIFVHGLITPLIKILMEKKIVYSLHELKTE